MEGYFDSMKLYQADPLPWHQGASLKSMSDRLQQRIKKPAASATTRPVEKVKSR